MAYDKQELKNLDRTRWFAHDERGYQRIQETKNVTLGYASHDSPVGMLAWFVGKLKAWIDNYPWTDEEFIHWAFIHYQGSPSAAMQIYKEAEAVLNENRDSMLGQFISQPVGGSLFPKELWLYPQDWMSETCNIQFWRQHDSGGYFIAWERPEALASDVVEFFERRDKFFAVLGEPDSFLLVAVVSGGDEKGSVACYLIKRAQEDRRDILTFLIISSSAIVYLFKSAET